jgi:hypothetical protein
VGKVEAFTIAGLDLWFNSIDHRPPHFHARSSGRWEIRVYILECAPAQLSYEVKWGTNPIRRHREQLHEKVLENRVALLEERERKVHCEK